MEKGFLILENGDVFEGLLFGKVTETTGEVVFNTSMTGYQEIITDPSYAGQIVTFCYPMIGNYGINLFDNESDSPKLQGIVIGDLCESPSHYQSVLPLSKQLESAGIVGITGVDTRELVKTIRNCGTIKGVITNQSNKLTYDFTTEKILLVDKVSTKEVKQYGSGDTHVVLIDYGYKKSILNALLAEGCKVTVVPYDYNVQQVRALQPDGLLFSNGPGDPTDLFPYLNNVKELSESYPTLGICLGHQLLALANGALTKKLKFGHRGANHPVKEMETGKVWMTSQNHGYVVVEESINKDMFNVSYRNVNDGSVEGLKHKVLSIQSVQFHPEAHAGPSDTNYIISHFVKQLKNVEVKQYAFT